MERVYAKQHEDHFEIQVAGVWISGKGKWTEMSLPERKDLVRKAMADALKLQCAWEGKADNGIQED